MKKLHGLIEPASLAKLLYGLLFCIAIPIGVYAVIASPIGHSTMWSGTTH